MAGRAGRSGRPGSGEKVAYQVRLSPDEAAAFDRLVERRAAETEEAGATASASGVLRAIVRKALLEEGLLPATATPGAEPTKPAPQKEKTKR